MNCNRVRIDDIKQSGKRYGYIVMNEISCEYVIDLYLFGCGCAAVSITETDRDKANKAYENLLKEYSY